MNWPPSEEKIPMLGWPCWHRAFDDPIPPSGDGELRTLRDAATYITKLPKREHDAAICSCSASVSAAAISRARCLF